MDPFEELLLRAYPNPERIGCPGSEVIHALANKALLSDDPVWQHVWKCSPCFAEFRELRDKRRSRERSARRKRLAYIGAVAAIALISVAIALTLLLLRRAKNEAGPQPALTATSSTYPAAILNLDGTSISRSPGTGAPGTGSEIQRLPNRKVDLTVYLPRGSQAGEYRLEFLDAEGDLRLTIAASAKAARGLTTFTVPVDLNKLPPGTYAVRSRRVPDGTWNLSRVIVE